MKENRDMNIIGEVWLMSLKREENEIGKIEKGEKVEMKGLEVNLKILIKEVEKRMKKINCGR